MRVNVYAEEMTDRVDVISKTTPDGTFTGLRFWLELPVTAADGSHVKGPFMHHPGDDDSSAVTFWGKRDLRKMLAIAQNKLDAHYGNYHADGEPVISWEQLRKIDAEQRGKEVPVVTFERMLIIKEAIKSGSTLAGALKAAGFSVERGLL